VEVPLEIDADLALKMKLEASISYEQLDKILSCLKQSLSIEYPSETTIRKYEKAKDIGTTIENVEGN